MIDRKIIVWQVVIDSSVHIKLMATIPFRNSRNLLILFIFFAQHAFI